MTRDTATAQSPADTIRRYDHSAECYVERGRAEEIFIKHRKALDSLERLIVQHPLVRFMQVDSAGHINYILDTSVGGHHRGEEFRSSVLRNKSTYTADSARMRAIGYDVEDLIAFGKLMRSAGMGLFAHMHHPEISHLRRFYVEFAEPITSGSTGTMPCLLSFGRYYMTDVATYQPFPASVDEIDGWGILLL